MHQFKLQRALIGGQGLGKIGHDRQAAHDGAVRDHVQILMP